MDAYFLLFTFCILSLFPCSGLEESLCLPPLPCPTHLVSFPATTVPRLVQVLPVRVDYHLPPGTVFVMPCVLLWTLV